MKADRSVIIPENNIGLRNFSVTHPDITAALAMLFNYK